MGGRQSIPLRNCNSYEADMATSIDYLMNTPPVIDAEESQDQIPRLQSKLEYFFMDPIQKWKRKNTKPWKLIVQILKIILFTWQLMLFGCDMAKFITYKDEMRTTFKQLLLKDWDPSSEGIAYPGPYIPYAVYTKPDFMHSLNYALRVYGNISELSVGPLGYQSNKSDVVSPISFCSTNYILADFDPTNFKYNYSMHTRLDCKVIDNLPPAGSTQWLEFDIRQHLDWPIDFSTMITTSVILPLRTVHIEDTTFGDVGIVCFNVDVEISYNNKNRDGQINIDLTSLPRRADCDGSVMEADLDHSIKQKLNLTVMVFCLISFSLCIRSIWRAVRLLIMTERIVARHGRKLNFGDRSEFIDSWLVIIIINDIMIFVATVIITFGDERILETDNYTVCSLLIGMGNLLSWSGLLRYLSFFRKYNLLLVTLKKSFLHVMRFMFCTLIIYCGFCFCGWIVFGPYHFKFRQLSTTTECLFSLINGDDMFETFALLRSSTESIWWFSRLYLYIFVSLFIYVVLSLFIALIMDAYEIIKKYCDTGFPRTRLQSLYLDGDINKLDPITR